MTPRTQALALLSNPYPFRVMPEVGKALVPDVREIAYVSAGAVAVGALLGAVSSPTVGLLAGSVGVPVGLAASLYGADKEFFRGEGNLEHPVSTMPITTTALAVTLAGVSALILSGVKEAFR